MLDHPYLSDWGLTIATIIFCPFCDAAKGISPEPHIILWYESSLWSRSSLKTNMSAVYSLSNTLPESMNLISVSGRACPVFSYPALPYVEVHENIKTGEKIKSNGEIVCERR